jgi:hypothetical protein
MIVCLLAKPFGSVPGVHHARRHKTPARLILSAGISAGFWQTAGVAPLLIARVSPRQQKASMKASLGQSGKLFLGFAAKCVKRLGLPIRKFPHQVD